MLTIQGNNPPKAEFGLDLAPVIDAQMEGRNKESVKGKKNFSSETVSHVWIWNDYMPKILFNS